MEIWKEVPEFDGYYASSIGRIRRLDKILPIHNAKKGYLFVNTTINSRRRVQFVHRLVAKAFLPNEQNLPQVNHMNGIKHDNRVDNLEWCTNTQNHEHARLHGLLPKGMVGETHPRAGLTEEQVLEIRAAASKLSKNGRGPVTRLTLAEKYGVSIHVIKDVIYRRSWTHI